MADQNQTKKEKKRYSTQSTLNLNQWVESQLYISSVH